MRVLTRNLLWQKSQNQRLDLQFYAQEQKAREAIPERVQLRHVEGPTATTTKQAAEPKRLVELRKAPTAETNFDQVLQDLNTFIPDAPEKMVARTKAAEKINTALGDAQYNKYTISNWKAFATWGALPGNSAVFNAFKAKLENWGGKSGLLGAGPLSDLFKALEKK